MKEKEQIPTEFPERKEIKKSSRKFDELFKQAKRMKPKKAVIVLKVDNNCTLRSENSFFVHRMLQQNVEPNEKGVYEANPWYKENESDFSDDVSCVTPKDLKDLRAASKLVNIFNLVWRSAHV